LSDDYDIICLTETWLNDDFSDQDILDDRYTIFRKDRNYDESNTSRGGGVMIAIKRSFHAKQVSLLQYSCEAIWIKFLVSDHINIYVCCVYFPPSADRACFNDFYAMIDDYFTSPGNIIIVGDFNLSTINWISNDYTNTSSLVHDFICFLSLHELNQCNFINNHMNRILDLVLTKLEYHDLKISRAVTPLIKEDDYHPALVIDLNKTDRHRTHSIKSTAGNFSDNTLNYNFKKADFNLLYTLLSLVDWNFLLCFSCINAALDRFYAELYEILDKCVPKTKTVKAK